MTERARTPRPGVPDRDGLSAHASRAWSSAQRRTSESDHRSRIVRPALRPPQIVPRPRAGHRLAGDDGLHVVPREMDVVGRHFRGIRREITDEARPPVSREGVTEQSSLEDDRPVGERHETGLRREHAGYDMGLEWTRIGGRPGAGFRGHRGHRSYRRAGARDGRVARRGLRRPPLGARRERQQATGKRQTTRALRRPRHAGHVMDLRRAASLDSTGCPGKSVT
jgi:hypothetical protein